MTFVLWFSMFIKILKLGCNKKREFTAGYHVPND